MPLESIGSLMRRAVRGGYAVGYFESWNIESLQGVIDAAEQTRSPINAGFNGGFLSGHDWLAGERLSWYAALGRAAAESAAVPCGLLFNECPSDDWVALAIKSGFNLVMPADASAPFDRYVERVSALARLAHAHGVAVEAEVGELPSGVAGHGSGGGSRTDPSLAARFVSATGIDLLAVSIDNVHVKVDGTQDLDLGRLAEIHRQVKLPLVLHGGRPSRARSGQMTREALAYRATASGAAQVCCRERVRHLQTLDDDCRGTRSDGQVCTAHSGLWSFTGC
jgi:fructose/tagatose bisphosphate aldolase